MLNKYILFWYKSIILLIFFIIIIGGLTRLTDSGLSITEWNVFTGLLPPLTNQGWLELFSKYQKIPEFIIENPDMNIQGFKNIFWLEYIHRIIARLIGIVAIVGLLYFSFNKNITKSSLSKIFITTILIPIQGLIGWYMVKSGLSDRIDVSHFMLAFHLCSAFFILFLVSFFFYQEKYKIRKFNFSKNSFAFLIIILMSFIQVAFGGFVAGLKAGLIYNQFPLMGNNFIPLEIYNLHNFNSFFSDSAAIQFLHRIFAYLVFTIILIYPLFFKLEKNIMKIYKVLIFLIVLQFIMGIFTLLTMVNYFLAISHQLLAAIIIYIEAKILIFLLDKKNYEL